MIWRDDGRDLWSAWTYAPGDGPGAVPLTSLGVRLPQLQEGPEAWRWFVIFKGRRRAEGWAPSREEAQKAAEVAALAPAPIPDAVGQRLLFG